MLLVFVFVQRLRIPGCCKTGVGNHGRRPPPPPPPACTHTQAVPTPNAALPTRQPQPNPGTESVGTSAARTWLHSHSVLSSVQLDPETLKPEPVPLQVEVVMLVVGSWAPKAKCVHGRLLAIPQSLQSGDKLHTGGVKGGGGPLPGSAVTWP